MKVTRYINQRKWEGAIPPLLICNQGILEVCRHRTAPVKTASTTGKEKKQV